jgi:FKBP-type peptidyl-prolyl cis-trans isomerase
MRFVRTGAAVLLLVSCGGAPFPRDTTAANTRADDPWLEGGKLCSEALPGEAGLRVETLEVGSGKIVGAGETVRIHYVARSPDGKVVHDTHADGPPIEIIIGSTKILCGVERALTGMRAGEQRRVSVPAALAFGDAGKPPTIEPRTDLVFVIDLFLPADPTLDNGSSPVRPAAARGGRGPGGH